MTAASPAPVDPVLARRARIGRWARNGERLGYFLFLAAIAVFAIGATSEFSSAMVVVVVGCLIAGSLVLAPSIVIGYGVKAAARADRQREGGHAPGGSAHRPR